MPIPNELITSGIQGEQYYKEYLEKVAKHQRYLVSKEGSDPDSPAPKPAKATTKSKPSAPKADLRPPGTKPASSQQPKPKPALAKSQEKKCKLVTKTFDKPSPAKRSKPGLVSKRRKPTSSLRAVEESLKSVHDAPWGLLPPVVIREPDSGKFQSLPDVQGKGKEKEDLKLTVEEWVILKEPSSHTGTLSSLQHLAKDFSFGELFFNDKPSEVKNEKTTVETKVESMVSVTIQHDSSVIPSMTTPLIDLNLRPDSPNVHRALQAAATETTMTTTTTHPPPPQLQQSTTDSMLIKPIVDWSIQALLQNRFRDLPEADIKEILHQRMWETNSYKANEDHMMLYEALEKSMNHDHTDKLLKELDEAQRKKKKQHDLPKTPPGSPPHQPPPPPPPAAASAEYTAWMIINTRLRPYVSLIPEDLHMDDDMAPDEQIPSFEDEDIENAHIPKVNLQQDWWKPLVEDRPATPKPARSIPLSNLPVPTNNWAFALASTYTPPLENSQLAQTECHKLLTDSVDKSIIRHNVSKPLPLGGPPGQVTIQSDFFFNKDLKYLRYGNKGGRPALSISKMKVAYYLDVGLEQMVPDQIADLNEHIIAERDFKYMYPSDFEDLYLLNLQGHLNRLPPKDKKILTIAVNLWTRYLVIKQHIEDFQLGIESYQTQSKRGRLQTSAANRMITSSLPYSPTANAAGIKDNAVNESIVYVCADDPNMSELEDISIFEDLNEDVFGAKADLNNLESTFQVSPIPTA
nr:hypothetical protein [Tanacetum cinerariifolium]